MKTAFVLSIVAVATAAQDKIWPSVLRSIQQTSTASVAVTIDDLNAQKDSSVFDWAKCKGLENEPVLLCNDLTKEEINSLAALPNVQKITNVADSSAPCPLNITPKPTTTAAAPTPSACDKPVEGIDYDGNDIKSTKRSNSDDCCNDCVNTPGCVLYVWTKWNDGTCFLKSSAGNSVPKWGVKAAKVTKPAKVIKPAGSCEAAQDNVDYDGNDIKSTKRSNSDDCCDDCAKTPGCVVYVWAPWNDGTCFLKSKACKSVLKWGVKSAKITKSAGSCQAAQANVDYNGKDIARISAEKDHCCALCLEADSCVGYSHYEGNCYLKGELGDASTKEGVTSGVRD
ncbi:hypothetical protein DYB35_012799 [Aphanomyces astaci]|uniref:Apple domain-containing protein n=1 Tax=Aphanomyces astaci TaxID=112090 RepID=A0A3R6ZU09_APHAT|nr:hypothetical protein DYB35_012799 [Aphanomyces astaci]